MGLNSDHPVIDFGAHIYPERAFPDFPDRIGRDIYDLVGPIFGDPELVSRRFDAAGVDGAVFSMAYAVGASVERVREVNDVLGELVSEFDHYYGLAALPVTAGGAAAAAEFERSLDEGLNGACVETKTDGLELTDPEFEPVWEVAERAGAPVFVHPKIHDSLAAQALDDDYRLNAIFGREIALAESICKVVHEGVLENHPDLDLVYHHTGGNIAAMIGRIHLQLEAGRWPGQDQVKPFEEFKLTLRDRIYVDTCGFFGYQAPLRAALEVFSPSGVLFGTDHPVEARTDEELRRLVTNTEQVCLETGSEDVLGRNALELLANT